MNLRDYSKWLCFIPLNPPPVGGHGSKGDFLLPSNAGACLAHLYRPCGTTCVMLKNILDESKNPVRDYISVETKR
jgi:hypothetical protein